MGKHWHHKFSNFSQKELEETSQIFVHQEDPLSILFVNIFKNSFSIIFIPKN